MIKLKLALGTAQFGLDYGINNNKGQITKQEAQKILKFALEHKLNFIDTAQTYGDSELIIGEFILNNKTNFKIISKFSTEKLSTKLFDESLKRLHSNRMYGCLVHDFESFKKNPSTWTILRKLKKEQKVKKIGFSLYYPKEVEYLLERKIPFDIIQVPFSILDQRFNELFPLLKKKKIEIHVRSVFLQGLLFKNPNKLKGEFKRIKNKLTLLQSISKENNIPLSALCINFAALNKYIDKIVIGVDSLKNLQENVNSIKYQKKVSLIYTKLQNLKELDERIILPLNWSE
ncbi:MAG: aldo/keto reductase [Nanoarchaeota archaeon]|nr:aldo/keto reductase [Nanoarchaeota archaeon]